MAFIGVYGSHCAGKTTHIMDWWNSLNDPSLDVTVHTDGGSTDRRYCNGLHTKSKGDSWTCKAVEKAKLVEDCVADDTRVHVVESYRLDIPVAIAVSEAYIEYGGGAYFVLIPFDMQSMHIAMKKRCQKANKQFRPATVTMHEAYWRYLYRLPDIYPVPYKVFQMDAEYATWQYILADIQSLVDRPMDDWYEQAELSELC